MARFRMGALVDDTEQTVSATAAYITSIRCYPGRGSTADIYLQVWNDANPNPATTEPDLVIEILQTGGTALSANVRPTVAVFPGGLRFTTAITALVTTTAFGATVPTGADVPAVEIDYAPIL